MILFLESTRLKLNQKFDNSTQGTPWFGHEEISLANNLGRVIFSVESVDITLGKPNQISCLDDVVFRLCPTNR